MIVPRTFYRPPSPPPARVRSLPERLPRELMRHIPLALLKEPRDEQAARLTVLKAELVEAQRAAAAEPPTPEPAPVVLESAPSRVLLGA
jgi:hypothetical protein